MNAKELITNADFEYAVSLRRQIHRHPELGFDLDNTVAIVKQELDSVGIPYTEEYGKGSVVGYLNWEGSGKVLAIRADMDALPVEEKTGLPYSSQIPGRMHACGHDSHTAALLTVARVLKRVEKDLPCRVKLLFQPSEECEQSGAKMMMENGAVDDVDLIICTHCDNAQPVGTIGWCAGDYMSACDPITITFFGKTAHATLPEQGIDAIAMAEDAICAMKKIVKEEADGKFYVFSVGYFHGGTAHNVIADQCVLKISHRYYDAGMRERIRTRCMACCEEVAKQYGGSVEINWQMSAPALHNDEALMQKFVESMEKIMPDQLLHLEPRRSTEDFAWFLQKKPGFLFRFGTGNAALGCTTLAHCNDFRMDENGILCAMQAFTQFVLDAGAL